MSLIRSVDITQVNSVLSDMSTLETEISLHTEAVLSGRLNEEQLRLQYLQQQQFLTGLSFHPTIGHLLRKTAIVYYAQLKQIF